MLKFIIIVFVLGVFIADLIIRIKKKKEDNKDDE